MHYIIAGHVCKDIVPGGFELGGTITYSGLMAAKLGVTVTAHTCAQPNLALSELHPNIQWQLTPDTHTTTFENIYDQATGARHQRLLVRAATVKLPSIDTLADIVHLAPVANEIDVSQLPSLPSTTWLVATPQGWMRQIDPNGNVRPTTWKPNKELLSRLYALVFSEEDVNEDITIARHYAAAGPTVLYTRNRYGAILLHKNKEIAIPAVPAQVIDATGAGDVIAAAFLVRFRETGDPVEAARFGVVAAAIAIEHTGTHGLPTRAQIEARMV